MTAPTTDARFQAALSFILRDSIEGGFVDDPKDAGGATNLGISIRAVRALDADGHLDAFMRDVLDIDDDGDIDVDDVKGWTREIAERFYRRFYWEPIRGDELPWPLALVIFDAAVNQGVASAIALLQRVAGVKRDGIIGLQTIAAAARRMAARPDEVLEDAIVARLDRYRTLPTASDHFRGWARRMCQLLIEALKEA